MLEILPREILLDIFSLAGPRINFVVGIPSSPKQLLLGGGPCAALEAILEVDADIKSLLNVKPYIPAHVAIYKAMFTNDESIAKRVCIMWDIWESDNAFSTAWDRGFAWGINHIRPITKMTIHQYNQVYFEVGMMDKIDLTVESPFEDVKLRTCDYIKAEGLFFEPYRQSLKKESLLRLLIIKEAKEEVHEIINSDIHRELPLEDILCKCLSHNVQQHLCTEQYKDKYHKLKYKFPIDLLREYEEVYNLDDYEIEVCLSKQRNVEALDYFGADFFKVHKAFINKDVDTLNNYLISDREATVALLFEFYIPTYEEVHLNEILFNTDIKLDSYGRWVGLVNTTNFIEEGIEEDMVHLQWGNHDCEIDEEELDRVGLTNIAEICDSTFESIYTLKYLEIHGVDELDDIEESIKLTEDLSVSDLRLVYRLIGKLLDKGYNVVQVEEEPIFRYNCPLTYIKNCNICYTDNFAECVYPYWAVRSIINATDLLISLDTYVNMISENY